MIKYQSTSCLCQTYRFIVLFLHTFRLIKSIKILLNETLSFIKKTVSYTQYNLWDRSYFGFLTFSYVSKGSRT